jgi:hypothetical protein
MEVEGEGKNKYESKGWKTNKIRDRDPLQHAGI